MFIFTKLQKNAGSIFEKKLSGFIKLVLYYSFVIPAEI